MMSRFEWQTFIGEQARARREDSELHQNLKAEQRLQIAQFAGVFHTLIPFCSIKL